MSTLTYTPSYRLSVEDEDVVIRLQRDLVAPDALGRFLDYLELESIRQRSQLTPEQAAALADEIDRVVWESVRRNLVEA